MVNNQNEQLDAVFHALADPTRRDMLLHLKQRPCSVGDLAAPFAMTLAAVSKHIKVLERAGLVKREVQGRTHICRLDARPMFGGLEWIRHYEQFWSTQLDSLESALLADNREAKRKSTPKSKPKPKS